MNICAKTLKLTWSQANVNSCVLLTLAAAPPAATALPLFSAGIYTYNLAAGLLADCQARGLEEVCSRRALHPGYTPKPAMIAEFMLMTSRSFRFGIEGLHARRAANPRHRTDSYIASIASVEFAEELRELEDILAAQLHAYLYGESPELDDLVNSLMHLHHRCALLSSTLLQSVGIQGLDFVKLSLWDAAPRIELPDFAPAATDEDVTARLELLRTAAGIPGVGLGCSE